MGGVRKGAGVVRCRSPDVTAGRSGRFQPSRPAPAQPESARSAGSPMLRVSGALGERRAAGWRTSVSRTVPSKASALFSGPRASRPWARRPPAPALAPKVRPATIPSARRATRRLPRPHPARPISQPRAPGALPRPAESTALAMLSPSALDRSRVDLPANTYDRGFRRLFRLPAAVVVGNENHACESRFFLKHGRPGCGGCQGRRSRLRLRRRAGARPAACGPCRHREGCR
jgi:hypothetical protein